MIARAVVHIAGTQHLACSKCGRLLPITEFYTIRGGNPHSWCKCCYRDWRQARRAAQPRLPTSAPRVARGPSRHQGIETTPEIAELQARFLGLRSPVPAGFTGRPALTSLGVSP